MLQKLFGKLTGTGAYATKMVIVIRTDVPMGKGKAASQAAHAAVSLYTSADDRKLLDGWLRSGQPKVILKCDTGAALLDVHCRAVENGLNACKIFDAGRTQIERGTLTAVGIGPGKVEDVDKVTGKLKLL